MLSADELILLKEGDDSFFVLLIFNTTGYCDVKECLNCFSQCYFNFTFSRNIYVNVQWIIICHSSRNEICFFAHTCLIVMEAIITSCGNVHNFLYLVL